MAPHLTLNDFLSKHCAIFDAVIRTSCRRAADMPRPSPSVGAEAPRAAEPTAVHEDSNIAVGSYGEYFPALTAAAAWCVNAAVSKAAWWPWPLTLKVVSESRVT